MPEEKSGRGRAARKQADLSLQEANNRLQQYADQMQALATAALVINATLSLEEVLTAVAEQARLIIGAHQALTALIENQNWAEAKTAVSLSDKYEARRDYNVPPDGAAIYARLCQENQPIRLSQAELESQPGWHGFTHKATNDPPIHGWLAAPIVGRDGRHIGFVQLSDKYENAFQDAFGEGVFSDTDEAILVQLAQMALAAIENARLYDAVQSAEERFRQLAENINDVFWIRDLRSNKLLYVSPAYEEIWGYPCEQLYEDPDSYLNAVHPDDLDRLKAVLPKRKLGSFAEEFRIIREDGSIAWISARVFPVRNPEGRVYRLAGIAKDIGERKEVEKVVRQQEEQYRSIFNSASDGFLIFDFNGKIVEANRSACHMHGYNHEELIGRDGRQLLHPKDLPKFTDFINQVKAGQRFYGQESHVCSDGRLIQLELSATTFTFLGKPHILATIRDITARQKAAASLQEETRAVEALYRVSLSLAAERDLGALVQTVTDEATVLTGAEFGAFFYTRHTGDEESYELYALAGAARESLAHLSNPHTTEFFGPTFRGEAIIRLADVTRDPGYGRNLPYHGIPPGHPPVRSYLAVPVISRSGKVLGGLFFGHSQPAIFRERHERLAAGIAASAAIAMDNVHLLLAEREQREIAETLRAVGIALSTTFETEVLFQRLLDHISRVVPYNSAHIMLIKEDCAHIAYSYNYEASAGNQRALEATNLIFDIEATENLRTMVKSKQPLRIPDVHNYPGWLKVKGTEHIQSWVGVPIIIDEKVVAIFSLDKVESDFYQDYHTGVLAAFAGQAALALQNTQLFQQVQNYAAELEQHVSERTSQLEHANQELEAFSYSVSHDLRTPLRSIDGFSQTLLENYGSELDETGRHYLQRVRAASQRMGQLIDDLLKLAKVTRSELKWDMVNLSELAHIIATDLRLFEPDRQVEFRITNGLEVRGDAQLLHIALYNLLDNAWKFSSTRSAALVEFGAMPQTEAGPTVYYVRDNGVGFDIAYNSKIFGPFQRLHKVEDFPGTGIGLATVHRVILRHGGRIWVEAAINKGATFYFTL